MFRIDLQEGTRQFLTGESWSTGTSCTDDLRCEWQSLLPQAQQRYLLRHQPVSTQPLGHTRSNLIQGYEGSFGGDGGPLAWAWMSHARGVALDAQGNLYIADTDNNRVRKVTAINGEINPEESIITTVAGNGRVVFL